MTRLGKCLPCALIGLMMLHALWWHVAFVPQFQKPLPSYGPTKLGSCEGEFGDFLTL